MHDPVYQTERSEHLRSVDIVRLLSARSLWRVVRGSLRAPFDAAFAGSPLAVCWFTNFTCNARCAFCCKGDEIAAGREAFPVLPPGRFEELLVRIRRSVDLLYLSGGEPLIHPHILDILRAARRLEFRSVGLSSNLIALDRVPEVLEYVDVVSVSIHSPDVDIHAANLGVPRVVAERVFKNLELVKAARRRRRLKLLVNCVINEGNLASVPEMVAFTKRHGCMLGRWCENNVRRGYSNTTSEPQAQAWGQSGRR
jgi:MoaA/NifB/PqqE/SkfB family radical SAM enzyme